MRIPLKLPVIFFKLPVIFFKFSLLFFKFSLLFFKFSLLFFKFAPQNVGGGSGELEIPPGFPLSTRLAPHFPVIFFREGLGEGRGLGRKCRISVAFSQKKRKLFNIWTGKSGRFFLFGAFFGGGRAGRGEGNPARSVDFRRSGGGVGRKERREATNGEGEGKFRAKKFPAEQGCSAGRRV